MNLGFMTHTSSAQEKNAMGNLPTIFYLSPDRSAWVTMFASVQLWSRVTQHNPGTTVYGELTDRTMDLSIRRFRMGMSALPAKKVYAYIQLGINNLNYLSPRGTSIDLLDAYAEYRFSSKFAVGGGKSAWDGLSRYTSPSTSKALGYDIPMVALPTVNETDDLIRRLSIYFKGQLGKLDYRLIASKPFPIQNSSSFNPQPVEGISKFANAPAKQSLAGYLKWQFHDKESNSGPFSVGTYYGSKRIMNLGAGLNYQPDALWNLQLGDTVFNDMILWSVDYFLDQPMGKEVLTFYMAYFDFDFGPNYTRNIGVSNPADGLDPELASFNGRGNSFPIVGTGQTIFWQAALLFPQMGETQNLGRLQPVFSLQRSDHERLHDIMIYYDIGMNWILSGHLSKFSLAYQNRPIYYETANGLTVEDRKGMWVLQYEFRFE